MSKRERERIHKGPGSMTVMNAGVGGNGGGGAGREGWHCHLLCWGRGEEAGCVSVARIAIFPVPAERGAAQPRSTSPSTSAPQLPPSLESNSRPRVLPSGLGDLGLSSDRSLFVSIEMKTEELLSDSLRDAAPESLIGSAKPTYRLLSTRRAWCRAGQAEEEWSKTPL